VFLYGAECWTLRKVDEHRILTADTDSIWIWRLAGIIEDRRRINDDNALLELNQMATVIEKIETRATMVRACTAIRYGNTKLPAKALATSVTDTRSEGRQKKW